MDKSRNPQSISQMAYLVEAIDLLGRSHTIQTGVIEPGDNKAVENRKEKTNKLTKAAKDWFETLPFKDGNQTGLTLMIVSCCLNEPLLCHFADPCVQQAIYHATQLKLNAYYAFPALSNGGPIEPYNSACLESCRAVASLAEIARSIGWIKSATPYFVWGCWVAARVLFVHAFLAHQTVIDNEFDTIVVCLKEQSQYWGLASKVSISRTMVDRI